MAKPNPGTSKDKRLKANASSRRGGSSSGGGSAPARKTPAKKTAGNLPPVNSNPFSKGPAAAAGTGTNVPPHQLPSAKKGVQGSKKK